MPDVVTLNADDLPRVAAAAEAVPLRQHIDRIIRVKAEISGLQEDVAQLYAAAKSDGYDRKALATTVRRLLADPQAVREQDELTALYENAYRAAGGSGVGH
jgi:uncharacterized protein (UPF0335 family)